MSSTQKSLLKTFVVFIFSLSSSLCVSQDSAQQTEDGWVFQRDEQAGLTVRTKQLTIYPKAEPRPALKHRFFLDDFERTRGNSAIFYLKAAGFFEQQAARERLSKYQKDAVARANKEGKSVNDVAPYVWLEMAPSSLPLKEVKDYLGMLSFQPNFISEGARRTHFDMDRNLREVDDPIGYLLPEIQGLRELARNQSIRCRLAIAEGRVNDAIEVIGQQFALARHLGDDEVLVSNLVGIAIAHIAWNDALYLVQHPSAPNLYWALATMPRPVVDIRKSLAMERQFLYQQIKVLREVNDKPRPTGYWQDFIDRLLPQMGLLSSELNMPSYDDNPDGARIALVAYVAAAYPGAKEFLINELKMPQENVEAYPTAQVVFLAMARFYDQWRDDIFKWAHVPLWQARSKTTSSEVDNALRKAGDRYGWCTQPTLLFLPAILAAKTAEARCDQTVALVQTVEAIRMYAADNAGKLPPNLGVLRVPAPIEPFTGKPISYQRIGDKAVLSGHTLPGMRYRLVVQIAK